MTNYSNSFFPSAEGNKFQHDLHCNHLAKHNEFMYDYFYDSDV